MAKYRINAPQPGAYVEGYGLLETDSVHILADTIPPQKSFIPIDDAAHAVFERWNHSVVAGENPEAEAHVEKQLEGKGLIGKDAEKAADLLRKKFVRKPGAPIVVQKKAPTEELLRARREVLRLESAVSDANKREAEKKAEESEPAKDPEPKADAGKKRASDS
jgi:hypothetical protein